MAGSNQKVQVTLDAGFEGAVVRGGIRIEFNANGAVDVYAPVPVVVHTAVNDSGKPTAKAEPKLGDTMPESTEYAGMKYAGISPDTGKPFYVDAEDAPGIYTFDQAQDYAGSQGKRVPTKAELNVLFNNKASIGGFNVTGSHPAGWYWSSSRGIIFSAWAQRFSDGYQDNNCRDYASSLRCVR